MAPRCMVVHGVAVYLTGLAAGLTMGPRAPMMSAGARAINAACAASDVSLLRQTLAASMDSFGSAAPPVPKRPVSLEEFEEMSGLSPAACAPAPRPVPAGDSSDLGAAACVVSAQLLLAAAVLPGSVQSSPLATLRALEWWQLPAVLLGTAGVSVLLVALLDRLALGGAVLRVLSSSIRREVYIRHEAGHTLLALLLGCPVQAVVVSPWVALADPRLRGSPGTVFYAPALEAARAGAAAQPADVDAASIILMGGIAAEALAYGSAGGGASDEADLRQLLDAQHSPQLPPAVHARWAATNAVLLLRQHAGSLEQICDVLRAGGTVGECCVQIDAQLMRERKLGHSQPAAGARVAESL